jgi:PAS domain S-box-containing protein
MPFPAPEPDYRSIFEATPGPYLILDPDWIIVAVNDAYLAATMTRRRDILGQHIFGAFPDPPDDPEATGVANLRASLQRVCERRQPDRMAVQKYDIRRLTGEFEERHWSPLNLPVLGADGRLNYIVHHVEDVTNLIHLEEKGLVRDAAIDVLRVMVLLLVLLAVAMGAALIFVA